MDPLSAAVLGMVADGFIAAAAGNVTDKLRAKLSGDPARNAIKQAIGAAVGRYAVSGAQHLELVGPLLRKDGPLAEPRVAGEIAKLVLFDARPDAALIARRWKAALESSPTWRDFTEDANILLRYIEEELRQTEVFRPVFDSRRLDAIAADTASSAAKLSDIEARLAALADLLDSRFGELLQVFARTPVDIRASIRDDTRFISEKTSGFIGRQFVFDAIAEFVAGQERGYFFVRGDPGIGKSALAAQLVKTKGYVHHFNRRGEGINKVATFLKNICAQLIAAYRLDHTALPDDAVQDAGFFNQLLGAVSDKLGPGEKAVVVVDALDEVDQPDITEGANPLYLPLTLPPRIYVVATLREGTPGPRVECEEQTLYLTPDLEGNQADIRAYVEQAAERPGIQAYMAAQGVEPAFFVEHLATKSQGNFMYLRYVLPEIERGAYSDLRLEALPSGLERYYEDHWRRMGMIARPLPRAKIKILYILAEVHQPVSRELIGEFASVDPLTVQAVLDEWDQFLHEQPFDDQTRYSLYHASFRDFLHRKEILKAAGVTIKRINALIADTLWQGLFDDA